MGRRLGKNPGDFGEAGGDTAGICQRCCGRWLITRNGLPTTRHQQPPSALSGCWLPVASLAVKEKLPSDSEQAARDAIRSVVDVRCDKFEPDGRNTAPDWRMWMTDGRIADLEVTSCTNRDAREFINALLRDGNAKTTNDPRLVWAWNLSVGDPEPDRRDRTLGKLIDAVIDVLLSVESEYQSPEQMQNAAQSAIDLSSEVQDLCGEFRYIRVNGTPEHLGDGHGMARIYPVALGGYVVHPSWLVEPIQRCIKAKADQRRLDDAPDRRWVAVVLEDDSGPLFNDLYGPGAPTPPPVLDVVPDDYFHEAWLVAETRIGEDRQEGFAVLRLSEGGSEQAHHIVPRLVAA